VRIIFLAISSAKYRVKTVHAATYYDLLHQPKGVGTYRAFNPRARGTCSQPTADNDDSWPAIEDYAIIGDCRSAALVSRYGSIDWLCWPRFDRPSIFAALLDRKQGGFWRISPIDRATIKRRYVPDSNVLETHFTIDSGTAILIDLMPGASHTSRENSLMPDHEIIRKVTCVAGEMDFTN